MIFGATPLGVIFFIMSLGSDCYNGLCFVNYFMFVDSFIISYEVHLRIAYYSLDNIFGTFTHKVWMMYKYCLIT